MNKAELVNTVANLLRENNIKKPVHLPKRVFTITDNEGTERVFPVKPIDKEVLYTVDDVKVILDMITEVITDNVKHGVETSIYGLGVFETYLRAGRMTKTVNTGELVKVNPKYVPRFVVGTDLKRAALVYDMMLREQGKHPGSPQEDEEE